MTLRIGHRGASGYAPENTIVSFEKALELDVDMVELDVHVCGSGEVVVIHDEMVDRTTEGEGKVSAYGLEELKELNAGGGERIPTLEEVIDAVGDRARINVELKGEGTGRPVAEIIERYVGDSELSYDDFLVTSFYEEDLVEFMGECPEVETGILFDEPLPGFVEYAEWLDVEVIGVNKEYMTPEIVEEIHEAGFEVYAWTANKWSDIHALKAYGVDGVISDYPDRV